MEEYRLDSHKLIFHPDRVAGWLRTGDTYPINIEIGISGACNHRCIFCSMDYMGYKPEMLSKELLMPNIKEMHQHGLKSIVLAGNGEPFLNKDTVSVINESKKIGVDVAVSTNGVLFDKDKIEECLESLTWIRFSTSAFSDDTYQKIHGTKSGDIEKVFEHIKYAAEWKKKKGLKSTIGVQLVLIPENVEEAYSLGKYVRELGADYFTIKSFGFQPQSSSALKTEFSTKDFYAQQLELEKKIESLNTDTFTALYRSARINNNQYERPYKECYALPFYSFIDSSGSVWPCCILLGNEGMCFGNIYEQSFYDIWNGEQRKEAIDRIRKTNLGLCSKDCRLDAMNRYLQELKYPGNHVNFI